MAEKTEKKQKYSQSSLYKIEGDQITATKKNCPKCGKGIFLAEHKDRLTCGKCSFSQMKGGGMQN